MLQRHNEPVEVAAGIWALLPSCCWLLPVQDAGREREEVELARRNRWAALACAGAKESIAGVALILRREICKGWREITDRGRSIGRASQFKFSGM